MTIRSTICRAAAIALCVIAACGGEHRPARDTYNEGVAALARGEYEAAEKALLEARNLAGVDPELVFRATYDLGVAFAAHADQIRNDKDADLSKAVTLAETSRWWFGDAARLRPDHADTATNLGIMRARVQALSDELRKGEGKLEVRLDRLINDQRTVLDGAREAWLAVKIAGGGDPLAQQGTLTQLADRERGIVAEAGVVGDLAADEIDAIGKKPDDKRSDEEKVRVVQLKNLDLYLIEGRAKIAEARRKLQELAAEDGVARAEAALTALKRAREQLLDPITVLQQIARDQLAVAQETAFGAPKPGALGDAPAELPEWLAPPLIAVRQGSVRDRLEEVRARMSAASEKPAADGQDPATAPAKPEDPKQQKLLERVRAALPAIGDASGEMDRARQALIAKQVAQALDNEQAALAALARAIEQFSDLKQIIELAYGEQQQLVQLLGPEAAKQLDGRERAKQTRDALSRNLARMPRIQELLADETAQLDEQAAQAAQKAGEPPPGTPPGGLQDPKAAEAHKQQAEQAAKQVAEAKQQMARAEELRSEAQVALAALDKALTGGKDPVAPAKQADVALTELRKLFFSVIEHLKELIREQGETRDQTSAASSEDQFTREPKLPGLIGRQEGHAALAQSITEALAAQADAANQQPQGQGAQGQPDGKALAEAAEEVRKAQGEMGNARGTLVKARDATQSSESLKPGVESQGKAIEHLENALKRLQPPQDKNNQDQQQQQQQQDQQDQKQEQQQQQQGGAGQRARDQDAQRQRDRRNAESANDPVEKDW